MTVTTSKRKAAGAPFTSRLAYTTTTTTTLFLVLVGTASFSSVRSSMGHSAQQQQQRPTNCTREDDDDDDDDVLGSRGWLVVSLSVVCAVVVVSTHTVPRGQTWRCAFLRGTAANSGSSTTDVQPQRRVVDDNGPFVAILLLLALLFQEPSSRATHGQFDKGQRPACDTRIHKE
jgi:hypothetical protein